jgi:acyl-CoA synthetase (AMP-forming)/AMP-acid ligase II
MEGSGTCSMRPLLRFRSSSASSNNYNCGKNTDNNKIPASPHRKNSCNDDEVRDHISIDDCDDCDDSGNDSVVAPLVAQCQHTLQNNGSIVGTHVAEAILPIFPTLASAIPTGLCQERKSRQQKQKQLQRKRKQQVHPCSIHHCATSSLLTASPTVMAIASIDGRVPIDHERLHDFIVHQIGPCLHRVGIGRGNRVAVILPNGPELALAILAIANWAVCVPLNASSAKSELSADLTACGADLVIGPFSGVGDDEYNAWYPPGSIPNPALDPGTSASGHPYHVLLSSSAASVAPSDDFQAFGHVQDIADELCVPFLGVIKSKVESGIFHLVTRHGSALYNNNNNNSNITPAAPNEVKAVFGNFMSLPLMKPRHLHAKDNNHCNTSGYSSSSSSTATTEMSALLNSSIDESEATADELSSNASSSLVLPQHRTIDEEKSGDASTVGDMDEIDDSSSQNNGTTNFSMNMHHDEVLVLFTSGTTGAKKIVPHCLGDLLVASATIALSWNLTPNHVNCNLMPLFHVGGIVRQVFSPVLSGGSVICCPSFDPTIFWALLENRAFTWYYAAPTMHQLILQSGKETVDGKRIMDTINPKLHMIANAAGGLLPSLALELKAVFKANVLPSYGMTECMPISSPPSTYQLEKTGTSGVPVGPEVAILNLATMKPYATGSEGAICVRGTPCFRGYGFQESGTVAPETFLDGGWFNTGDLGYLDEDGYLFITGRAKEVINRGGETISPMEVEEAVLSHSSILSCAAFSISHDVLQEVVGIVVVFEPKAPRIDLPTLHKYLGEDRLAAQKWPQCMVIMDGLPRSHTNKLLRVKLGERLRIPTLNDGMRPSERTFVARCPPKGTDLEEPIPCTTIQVDSNVVCSKLSRALAVHNINTEQELHVVPHPRLPCTLVAYAYGVDAIRVAQTAVASLDIFEVPRYICTLSVPKLKPIQFPAPQAKDATESIIQSSISLGDPVDSLVVDVQEMMRNLLRLDFVPSADANFFHLGGSSMLASQLASKIRKLHNVPFGGAEVFQHSSALAIATVVRTRCNVNHDIGISGKSKRLSVCSTSTSDRIDDSPWSAFNDDIPFGTERLVSRMSWWKWLLQLVPLCIVLPTVHLSRFFFYFMLLLKLLKGAAIAATMYSRHGKDFYLLALVLTLVLYHIVWVTIMPLVRELFVRRRYVLICLHLTFLCFDERTGFCGSQVGCNWQIQKRTLPYLG